MFVDGSDRNSLDRSEGRFAFYPSLNQQQIFLLMKNQDLEGHVQFVWREIIHDEEASD
jgi:hypothetical protein